MSYGSTRNGQPYNGTPGFKERTTSRDAAIAMSGQAANLRNLALAAIAESGSYGLSADEVAGKLNQSVLAIRPRITELGPKHLDEIERVPGVTRLNKSRKHAAVWRVKSAPVVPVQLPLL